MARSYKRHNNSNVAPLKGVSGILIVTAFLLVFVAVIIIMYTNISNQDTKVTLDQESLDEYCETQYSNGFRDSESYEDNVLFVFLYDDTDYSSYKFGVYTGKHFMNDAKNYLQGYEVRSTINRYFDVVTSEEDIEYSLYLSFQEIALEIDGKISSYHYCNDKNEYISRFKNKTEYEFDSIKIEESLKAFTDTTDLSVVLLVDTLDDVAIKNNGFNQDIFVLILIMGIVLVIITAAYIIVIKNTIHDKKIASKSQNKKTKSKKIEEKDSGLESIPGMDYFGNDDKLERFKFNDEDFDTNKKD
ncbi:MAG: hypothetical protein IJA65_05690 [Acholeplasmatales bacterium]|nr:hypothetical protein [Acholeplasmatales bacterium]